ncbi:MAG: hypothetical protein ABJL99_15115 [Aliishimia sp.]
MLRCLLVGYLFVVSTSPCFAGAWPREKGTAFVATDFVVSEQSDGEHQSEQALYLEYGATEKLTLGLSVSYNPSSSAEGHVFLRFPLANKERPSVTALEFGLGAKSVDAVTYDTFLKTGLSWGRGVELYDKNGWINVDNVLLWDVDAGNHRLKVDATLGLNLTERIKVLGQSFIEVSQTSESLTLMPSVVVGFKSGKTNLMVGLETKFGDGARKAVKFGLWNEF